MMPVQQRDAATMVSAYRVVPGWERVPSGELPILALGLHRGRIWALHLGPETAQSSDRPGAVPATPTAAELARLGLRVLCALVRASFRQATSDPASGWCRFAARILPARDRR